jgi:ABC-type multidrug transport system ATPase subunit
MIEVQNLTKEFNGKNMLNEITFKIKEERYFHLSILTVLKKQGIY